MYTYTCVCVCVCIYTQNYYNRASVCVYATHAPLVHTHRWKSGDRRRTDRVARVAV